MYRGSAIEKLRGAYLFADFGGARLGALFRCAAETSPAAVLRKVALPPRTYGAPRRVGAVVPDDDRFDLVELLQLKRFGDAEGEVDILVVIGPDAVCPSTFLAFGDDAYRLRRH